MIEVVESIRLFSLEKNVLSANVNHFEIEIFQIHCGESKRERLIAKNKQFFLSEADSVADEAGQILKFGKAIM